MNICFITDNPGTTSHPVIGMVLQRLVLRHTVRLLDVRTLTGDTAIAQDGSHPLADIYLLKSHTVQALQVAHHLERQGALVVNSWASSFACQDRVRLAQRMKEACLPWPSTWSLLPSDDAPRQRFLSTLPFPLIIKSRYSCRGDLVEKVHDVERLQALLRQRKQES